MNNIQFVEQMVKENLWVRDIYIKHFSLYGNLSPYFFMDEVFDAFIEIVNNFLTSEIDSQENITKIRVFLETIENGLQTNSEEVIILILVGFIENISPEMRIFPFLRKIIKNATLEMLEYQYYLSDCVPSIGSAAGWGRVTVADPNTLSDGDSHDNVE